MTQESDDFDELEDLLRSARKHAEKMRERGILRRAARSQSEISQDYAERLAEKATFRRLLSDEALDGVRFRWLMSHRNLWEMVAMNPSTDLARKFIDNCIKDEESKCGPTT